MKETIYLEQNTPMWHFHGNFRGTTLRATEVKPKLDKFIVTSIRRNNITIPDNFWVNSKEKTNLNNYALKYQIRITPQGQRLNLNDSGNNYPLFFGNLADSEERKTLIYNPLGVEMTIFSLNPEIVRFIKQFINPFFAIHTFGTRQSKGFGCFYPRDETFINADETRAIKLNGNDNLIKFKGPKYSFNVRAQGDEQSKFIELFKHINYFHKIIRSGINEKIVRNGITERNVYYKSLLFHYANSKKGSDDIHLTWDKPVIRHNFKLYFRDVDYLIRCNRHPIRPNVPVRTSMDVEYSFLDIYKLKIESKYLFRDALGLAMSQRWDSDTEVVITKGKYEDVNGNDVEVERFKSPITYRPVKIRNGFTVYIYFDDNLISDNLRNAEFEISLNGRKISGMHIYPDFSLSDYFTFIYDKSIANTIIGLPQDGYAYTYINNIFSNDNFKKI